MTKEKFLELKIGDKVVHKDSGIVYEITSAYNSPLDYKKNSFTGKSSKNYLIKVDNKNYKQHVVIYLEDPSPSRRYD